MRHSASLVFALASTLMSDIELRSQITPNLLLDGSFEVGRVGTCSQGSLPSTWLQLSSVLEPADAHTRNDCAAFDGIPLGTYPHFSASLLPVHGNRFGAGCWCPSNLVEVFGTDLLTPLTPGSQYVLRGMFSASLAFPGNHGYDVELDDPATGTWVSVGSIGALAIRGSWTPDTLRFTAPVAARRLAFRPRTVGNQAGYVAVDSLVLSPTQTPTPPGVYALGGESTHPHGVPILDASGSPTGPGFVDFAVGNAPTLQAGVIVFGLSVLPQPVLGAILVPSPDLLWPVVTNATGQSAPIRVVWPANAIAGTTLYAQAWVLESRIPSGISASPTLMVR